MYFRGRRDLCLILCALLPLARAVVASADPVVPPDSLVGRRVSCVDFRSGDALEVRAQRITPEGAADLAWTPDANRLCTGPVATTYEYDPDRQLRDVLRPTGDSVHLVYDAAGRLWKVVQARGTSTLGYSSSTGQLQSVASPDGVTLSYGYSGSLPTSETWTGAVSGSVTWDYDPELLPRTETVIVGPATSTVTNHFDADGLLTQVDLPGGTAYTIARLPESGSSTDNGQIDSTQEGGVVESRGYNSHGELTNLRYRFGSTVILQQSLTRDALGRVTHLSETVDGATRDVEYGYDMAGRLEAVTVSGNSAASRIYVYDDSLAGNGNRTAEKDGTGSVLARPNYDQQDRLLAYGAASYTWTAAGEQALRATSADTVSTTYDPLGNLIDLGYRQASASGPNGPITLGTVYAFEVDGQNRRVRKLVNDTPVQGWIYRDALHPVAELDGAGAMLNRYVYATQQQVPDLILRGTVVFRVVTDHLGSVRAVVDVTTGAVAQRLDYDAWGNLTQDTAPTFQSVGYAGGIQDREAHSVRSARLRSFHRKVDNTGSERSIVQGRVCLRRQLSTDHD